MKISINDIFRKYKKQFKRNYLYKFSRVQKKAFNDIINCRTLKFGGRVLKCDTCNEKIILYNSCKNRHCPQCMNVEREKWLLSKKNNILPVKYYHVIFTLPNKLNDLIYSNQKILLNLFFKTVGDTILELGLDEKYLGAKTGILSIIHTWGQQMLYHPHIHCLIPAGGLNKEKSKWIHTKNKKFLFPVKVVSDLFKKKFLARLTYLFNFNYKNINLSFDKNFEYYPLKSKLYKMKWNVNIRPPYENPESVIEYFGRYSHKVVITDYRIIKLQNDKVTIKWQNNKTNKSETMELPALEFIRRYLLHILPSKLPKIRSYGIFANSVINKNIAICKKLLNYSITIFSNVYESLKKDTEKLLYFFCGFKQNECPKCKQGKLKLKYEFKFGENPLLI